MTLGGRVVDLNPVEMSLFDAIAKKLFWRLLELMDPAILEEMVSSDRVQMTRREMEALIIRRRHDIERDQQGAQHLQPHRRLVHERHSGKAEGQEPSPCRRAIVPARVDQLTQHASFMAQIKLNFPK